MPTTYSVNIWKTKTHKGKRVTAYYVRWSVDGKERHRAFRNKAQADSFRAELTTAARKGEAFDTSTGLPISTERQTRELPWYEFACQYTTRNGRTPPRRPDAPSPRHSPRPPWHC